MARFWVCAALLLWAGPLRPSAALAQQMPPTAAEDQAQQLCSGFNAETKQWGLVQLWVNAQEAHCPAGAAFLAHQMAWGVPNSANRRHVVPGGTCCPLPEGSLTDIQVYADVSCPPDHVVTGARIAPDSLPATWENEGKISYQLRCTKINTERYALGPAAKTLRIDATEHADEMVERVLLSDEASTTVRAFLPPYLRYGLGRESRTSWLGKFCVGYPWGSILTELGHRGCSGFVFHPLVEKKGRASQPSKCRGVQSIYSEDISCIP